MFTFEVGFENLFSGFESGFPPWDPIEPPFLFDTPFPDQVEEPVALFLPQQSQEPVSSSSGSDTSNPDPLTQNSRSSNPIQNSASKHLSSVTSDQTTLLPPSIIDERKRKRTQSNRESARRSRMRKQKHLENLGTQVNRQKRVNLELMNQLKLVVSQNEAVCRENEHLRLETVKLRQRLWDIRQVLLVRRLQHHFNPFAWQNNLTSINERPSHNHPLIT
ncbi:uncharacterized protein LOC142550287 [Primulina tabacum]|uniref:uncharacterized protein LOC142550287 n=1 Tax=Primulina tabacum TaxID=48773 RepID=UPI003F590A12